MTHSRTETPIAERHLRTALDHAQRLTEPRPAASVSPNWSAQAAHVGDLTVLALAMRD